jgi:hypothetical protein
MSDDYFKSWQQEFEEEEIIITDSCLEEIKSRLVSLVMSKNADYGSSVFQTILLTRDDGDDMEIDPDTAIRIRMHDKIARLEHLLDKNEPQNEPILDTYWDIAGYCLLIESYRMHARVDKKCYFATNEEYFMTVLKWLASLVFLFERNWTPSEELEEIRKGWGWKQWMYVACLCLNKIHDMRKKKSA